MQPDLGAATRIHDDLEKHMRLEAIHAAIMPRRTGAMEKGNGQSFRWCTTQIWSTLIPNSKLSRTFPRQLLQLLRSRRSINSYANFQISPYSPHRTGHPAVRLSVAPPFSFAAAVSDVPIRGTRLSLHPHYKSIASRHKYHRPHQRAIAQSSTGKPHEIFFLFAIV